MANEYIKILVCSTASGAWGEDAQSNSPLFNLADVQHSGLNTLDTYLTFRNIQGKVNVAGLSYVYEGVVVTINYNKITNRTASRDGRLKIGFFIPKGYRLPKGIDPYTMAEEIKQHFADRCLVKNDVTGEPEKDIDGRWRLSCDSIPDNVMDEVCTRYVLEPAPDTFVPMDSNPDGQIGMIECGTPHRIGQLLSDTQYEAFAPYHEIIAVEQAPGANYERVTVEIPRRRKFVVKGHGKKYGEISQGEYLTGDEVIKVDAPSSSDRYYMYEPMVLKWAEVYAGKVKSVSVDDINETIDVNFVPKPITMTYTLDLVGDDQTSREYINKNRKKVKLFVVDSEGNNEQLSLDDNGRFKLSGKDNHFFNSQNLKIYMPPQDDSEVYVHPLDCDPTTHLARVSITVTKKSKPKAETDFSLIGPDKHNIAGVESNQNSGGVHTSSLAADKQDLIALHIRVKDSTLVKEDQNLSFLLLEIDGTTGKTKRVLKIVQPFSAGSYIMETLRAELSTEGHAAKNHTTAVKTNLDSAVSKKCKQLSKQQRRGDERKRQLDKKRRALFEQRGNERSFCANEVGEEDSQPQVGREWVVGIPKNLCRGTQEREVLVFTPEWEWRSSLWPDIQSHGSIDIKEENILPKNQRVEMAKRYWREGVIAVLVVVIFLILTSGAFIASVTSLFRSHENSESVPAANVEIVEDKAAQSEFGPYDPGVQEIRADQTETEINGKSGLDSETEKAKSNNTINDNGQNGYGTGTAESYHGTGITDTKQ